jgi:hypothetical protein
VDGKTHLGGHACRWHRRAATGVVHRFYCDVFWREVGWHDGLHVWLPFLLVYLVYRLGYDRRALLYWSVLAWALVLFCYFFTPPPPAPAGSATPVNINYVFGLGEAAKQTWMPELAWLGLLLVALPTLFYLPAHFALKRFFPAKSERV